MNNQQNFKALTWIETTGGPLILLENRLLPYWHGTLGDSLIATDYDRACRISDYAGTVEVGPGFGLVLGEEPLSSTWWPSNDLLHAFLVRWVYAEDEASVHEALLSLSLNNSWLPTNATLEVVSGELTLFDSSCPGTDLDTYLTIRLDPERYRIETLHYKPNDELYLILHRFVGERSA